jgi:hypothetical protein
VRTAPAGERAARLPDLGVGPWRALHARARPVDRAIGLCTYCALLVAAVIAALFPDDIACIDRRRCATRRGPTRAARTHHAGGVKLAVPPSMRLHRVLALAVVLALPTVAGAQSDPRPLAGTRVAAQVGAGVVGTPIGFLAGGMATEWVAERMGVDDPRASRVALMGGWTGAALGAATGPALVGARGPGTGSYAAALGGALVGGAGSWLLVRVMDRTGDDPRPPCRIRCTLAAVAIFTLPSVGATIGYDASRREH